MPHQVPAELRREIVELEASVESTFNTFRGTIDGRRVDNNAIDEILRTSDDTDERRAAWEASKQIGTEVADRLRELARLRNRAARELGFRDHFALALATAELDEDRLFATLDDVDHATAEPFRAWKHELDDALAARFGVDAELLRPWHLDDPFFQETPAAGAIALDDLFADADLEALTVRTYDGLGLDVRPVLEHSDLYARDGKSQHAFCIDIDREGDVRVLCNVEPSERWMDTMLHEFGHAIYDRESDLRSRGCSAAPRTRSPPRGSRCSWAGSPAIPSGSRVSPGSRPTRSPRSAFGWARPGALRSSCSRGGCS